MDNQRLRNMKTPKPTIETIRRARLHAYVTGKYQTRTITIDDVATVRHVDDIRRKEVPAWPGRRSYIRR